MKVIKTLILKGNHSIIYKIIENELLKEILVFNVEEIYIYIYINQNIALIFEWNNHLMLIVSEIFK